MHDSSTKNRVSTILPLDEDSTDTTKSDKSLIEEVQRLKAEARRLEKQCELQNHEIQEIQHKIEESWSVAKEEAAKCKAAKEVIKSLTLRVSMLLKNDNLMDNTNLSMPESQQDTADGTLRVSMLLKNDNLMDNTNLSMPESQQDTADGLKSEWGEQYENGVYLTLTTSPNGEKGLKGIRFSRKLFAKKDAENWWEENYAKVIHKYGIEGYQK